MEFIAIIVNKLDDSERSVSVWSSNHKHAHSWAVTQCCKPGEYVDAVYPA